jgi:hypothetical protein
MIKAFSHPDFKRNQKRAKQNPCCICGKEIKDTSKAKMLRVNVHNEVVAPDAVLPEGEDLGWHAVGPDCLQNNPELIPLSR